MQTNSSCRVVFVVFALFLSLSSTGCAIAPNSGLPSPRWLTVSGPITNDTRTLPLQTADVNAWRVVRPSSSEQGLSQSDWEAAFLVLLPADLVGSKSGDSYFSESVRSALTTCAPDLGSFERLEDWQKSTNLLKTGKVRIGGQLQYQYVVHSVKWLVSVSDTGRGYRLANLTLKSFGSFKGVHKSRSLKETVRVAFGPPDRTPDFATAIVNEKADPELVTARCTGGALEMQGQAAEGNAGPWFSGILKQPFNVHIELQEEMLP